MSEARHRLLIVDDEPEILKILERAMRRDYQVTVTADPVEAADLIEHQSWDVLISDVDMPRINGYELVNLARRLRPKAIRILITGAGTMDGAIRAINEGEVHRYVPKPFSMAYIRQLVGEAMARKEELDEVAEAMRRVEERRRVEGRLEAEHPGLGEFSRDDDGAYVVDPVRATRAAARLGLTPLLSLEE